MAFSTKSMSLAIFPIPSPLSSFRIFSVVLCGMFHFFACSRIASSLWAMQYVAFILFMSPVSISCKSWKSRVENSSILSAL